MKSTIKTKTETETKTETKTETLSKEELKEAKKSSLERLRAFIKSHPELKEDFELVTKRSPRTSNSLKKSSDTLVALIKSLREGSMEDIEVFKTFKFGRKEMLDISRMIMIRYNKFITFENGLYTYNDKKPEAFKITSTKNEVELYDQAQIM